MQTRPNRSSVTLFGRATISRTMPIRRLRSLGFDALLVAVLGALLTGAPVTVQAQTGDGTGAAFPGPPSACEIPRSTLDLTSTETLTPVAAATPLPTRTAGTPSDATPVASSDATPVTPSAAIAPLTAELLSASTTITSCLTERNVETFTAITSDVFRGQQFGTGEPISATLYAELASTLLPLEHRIVELRDITVVDSRTVTTEVTYTVAYQRRTSIWTFTQDRVDGLLSWVLVNEAAAEPSVLDGASVLEVTMQDDAYTITGDETVGPDVAIALTNLDGEDHEALVLSLAEGTGTEALLRNHGPGLPEGVTFIGQATVGAGAEGSLVLANLPPGDYTIVCLLPDENGLPHLYLGMETSFTVT